MTNTAPRYDVQFFENLRRLRDTSIDKRKKALKDAVKRIEKERIPFDFGYDLFLSNTDLDDDLLTLLSIRICRDALRRSHNKAQVVTERSRKPLRLYFYGDKMVDPKGALDGMVTSFMAKKFRYLNNEDLVLVELIFGMDLDPTPEDLAYLETEMKKTSH
jgi:hypothetical protein